MNISVTRKYLVGQYQTIDIGEEVELPDKVFTNPELIQKIYGLIFINSEIAFKNYMDLIKELNSYNADEMLPKLNELKANTLEEIKFIFDKEN